MLRDLDELIGVQVCDSEIARLMAELTALPKRIAGLEAELAQERAALAAAENGLKAEEAARRRYESDVNDQLAKIKKYRAQVDTVQNDAQYKALLHEIGFAETNISKLEDAELESLERTDALAAARVKAVGEVAHYEELLERELESAAQTQSVHERQLQVLRTERARLREMVNETALAAYDRLAGAKKTPLAAAWEQKCSVCQMMVRPQRWNDLRNADGTEPINCESCGRRLYYDVGHGTEAAKEQVALRRLRELT